MIINTLLIMIHAAGVLQLLTRQPVDGDLFALLSVHVRCPINSYL